MLSSSITHNAVQQSQYWPSKMVSASCRQDMRYSATLSSPNLVTEKKNTVGFNVGQGFWVDEYRRTGPQLRDFVSRPVWWAPVSDRALGRTWTRCPQSATDWCLKASSPAAQDEPCRSKPHLQTYIYKPTSTNPHLQTYHTHLQTHICKPTSPNIPYTSANLIHWFIQWWTRRCSCIPMLLRCHLR